MKENVLKRLLMAILKKMFSLPFLNLKMKRKTLLGAMHSFRFLRFNLSCVTASFTEMLKAEVCLTS